MIKKLLLLVVCFLAVACSPSSVHLTSTAMVAQIQTQTAVSTQTFTPSPTFTPTNTPTETPIPTPVGGASGKFLVIRKDTGGEVTYYDGSKGTLSTDVLLRMSFDESISVEMISKAKLEVMLKKDLIRIGIVPSPDGSKVLIYACTSFRPQGCANEVYLAPLDLSSLLPIKVKSSTNASWEWSPDSTKLLGGVSFGSTGSSRREIYVMNIDDNYLKQLTNSSLPNYDAFWSPDSTQIFWSPDQGRNGFWVMNVDGSNKHRLEMENSNDVRRLKFSPDGKRVAFIQSNILYVANANFSEVNKILVVDTKYNNLGVKTWSPDNQYLLINYYYCPSSGCGGGEEIREIIRADNGQNVSLGVSENQIQDLCGWSPDNKFILISTDYLEFLDLSHLDSLIVVGKIEYKETCPIWLP